MKALAVIMKSFDYSAQSKGGSAISGTIESPNSESALEELAAMGLVSIELNPSQTSQVRRTLGREDMIFFNEQLASLADAGVSLDAGLRQLAKDVGSSKMGAVLSSIADDLERGDPLERAVEKHASDLPPLYGRVIQAGAASGNLSGTLLNLSHHLRLLLDTKRLVLEAISYPAVVLSIISVVMVGILAYVIPGFAEIFADFDCQLPYLTMVTIYMSQHLQEILIGCGSVAAIILLGLALMSITEGGRALRETIVRSIPVLGKLVVDSLRARFLRSAAFLVGNGIALPEAIRLAAGSTASHATVREAEMLATRIEGGESIVRAGERGVLIPPMFGLTVDVCSSRDNLPEALSQLARAYESRAEHSQSILKSWITPILVVVLGVLVAFCVLGLLMPLVTMINSIA